MPRRPAELPTKRPAVIVETSEGRLILSQIAPPITGKGYCLELHEQTLMDITSTDRGPRYHVQFLLLTESELRALVGGAADLLPKEIA